MDKLRRIIVPESENTGFNISCSDSIPVITEIDINSYARKAGLKIGDKLFSINGNLVRNMGHSEILNVLQYFRGKSLVLTVLPCTTNYKEEESNCPISKKPPEKEKKAPFPRYVSSVRDHVTCKPSRKFTKYSRNMSDVTDNFRYYYMGIRRGSSPRGNQDTSPRHSRYTTNYNINMTTVTSPRISPVLSRDSSRRKLQLNRVGGLVNNQAKKVNTENTIASSGEPQHSTDNNIKAADEIKTVATTNPDIIPQHLITSDASKTPIVNRRRSGSKHLPYLICSPIPYRSSKLHKPDEILVQPVETKVLEKESHEGLETIPPIKPCIMKQTNVVEEDDDASHEEECVEMINEEQIYPVITDIEPMKCRILWKTIRNEPVVDGSWKWFITSVENGVFRVEDAPTANTTFTLSDSSSTNQTNDQGQSSAAPSSNQNHSINPDHLYNFQYTDTELSRWDFVLEITDVTLSQKWTAFFEGQKKNKNEEIANNSTAQISKTNDNSEMKDEENNIVANDNAAAACKFRSVQSQIFHPTTVSEAIEPIQVKQTEAAPPKSRIHSALSRVRNFTTRRLTHSDSNAEFKRQQEEWLLKTDPHNHYTVSEENSHAMPVNICTANHNVVSPANGKVHIPHFSTLPLEKWQRSVTSPHVPMVVEIIVKVIEKYGLDHVGLYRVSGNKLSLDELNNELRKPLSEIDLSLDVWNDMYALSGILKTFLRNLPEGVFPKDFYFELISAWRQHEHDREKRLLSVQRLLSILDSCPGKPEYRYHRETLHYLACHLHKVASKSNVNKMNAKNLAVVFAPTLLRPPLETNEVLMADYRYRIDLIEALIKYHDWMFSPGFESSCNVPEDSDVEEEPFLTAMPSATTNTAKVANDENANSDASKEQKSSENDQEESKEDEDEAEVEEDSSGIETKQPPLAQPDDHDLEESEDQDTLDGSMNINGDARKLIKELIDALPEEDPSETPTPTSPSFSNSGGYTLIQLVPKIRYSATTIAPGQGQQRCVLEEQYNNPSNSCSESSSISSGANTPLLQSQNNHNQKHKTLNKESIPVESTSPKPSTRRKDSLKRHSFKFKKSGKSKKSGSSSALAAVSRDQFLLANKKLCALSMALVSSNSHPLNSPIMVEYVCGTKSGTTSE